MSFRTVLITGANGEMGHGLVERLSALPTKPRIIALDLNGVADDLARHCDVVLAGDVTDTALFDTLMAEDVDAVFHLAALLSSSGERAPERAHNVNVNGTVNILNFAQKLGEKTRRKVRVLFPSTIAVYGIASLEEKNSADKVREDQHTQPITMYGVNKLYCEHLGRYYSEHFRMLGDQALGRWVDFRSIRFPGIISAHTVPTGGTSDYAPEMLHSAAQGKDYTCFVRPDVRIPFMTMHDAISALMQLAQTGEDTLSQRVYNVGAFAPTAQEIAAKVRSLFPSVNISYEPHPMRQSIVDTWCADVDDSAARADWGWNPEHTFDKAFDEYLLPVISERYTQKA